MTNSNTGDGMKLFIWRHNRKYHSWSMIQEPCVHQAFYNDAIAMVLAHSEAEALQILNQEGAGWLVEELACLRPKIMEVGHPRVIFEEIRGD
jgi:hypothetical protein